MASIWGIPLSGLVWGAGRANRRQFWIVVALQWGLSFGLGFVAGFVGALTHTPSLVPIATLVIAPIATWIGVCNFFRRLHDLGRSGWWIVLAVPIFAGVGFIVGVTASLISEGPLPPQAARLVGYGLAAVMVITLGSLRGQPHANRFGPGTDERAVAAFD